ncbi:hypothetical protein K438DRAFT_1999969 [Mycena galopus ATCC 62051]|nr:hypothetical protein K438DRAFT_1999969 [Mycena galopus ATCC 62051]
MCRRGSDIASDDVSTNPAISAECFDEETDLHEPQDESDDDSDDDALETEISSISGHRWQAGNVEFQVLWNNDDVTWEPLSNVNDCAAMDDY